MKFIQALGRMLGNRPQLDEQQQQHLVRVWDIYEEAPHHAQGFEAEASPAAGGLADGALAGDAAAASPYDRTQWRRKLRTLAEKLPETAPRWADLMADVGPLTLDPAWVSQVMREEFVLLVRRAVVDARVTAEEHHTLDLARRLMQVSETDAEAILESVIAESESFFGKTVDAGK